MSDSPDLLTTAATLALLRAEAEAERAVAEPEASDPCDWVGATTQWVGDMTRRAEHALPVAVPGARGRSALFDPEAVREWFAEEFERHQAAREAQWLAGEATGILLTASMLSRELQMHPHTLMRRLREYNVQPTRTTQAHSYYRLGEMLAALTAAAKAEDPDSLPPTDRDAHWRAESRKDEVLQKRRELVVTREAVQVINALAAVLRDACDLIPDVLESRCRLAPEALAEVEREMDNARGQIAVRVRELQEQLQRGALAAPMPIDEEAAAA
jgi:hypothetical protein